MMSNYWIDGIMGCVVGDALGVPYEFKKRGTFNCQDMDLEYASHRMPKGTWSDDSSMIFATMDSIATKGKIDKEDIMNNFRKWLNHAEYCAVYKVFDCGFTVQKAIQSGEAPNDENSNGNGSLMRIMPICLFLINENISPMSAKKYIHEVSGLTHGHIRSKIACDFYYAIVRALILENGTLEERIQSGVNTAYLMFRSSSYKETELLHFSALKDIHKFKKLPESEIKSSGYVIDSLFAAIWCLLNSDSYSNCVLKAVNLGEDTDTIACIAGGLAGIYYGYDDIPRGWILRLQRLDFVMDMIEKMPYNKQDNSKTTEERQREAADLLD